MFLYLLLSIYHLFLLHSFRVISSYRLVTLQFSDDQPRKPIEISLQFTTDRAISLQETIRLELPLFTRRIPYYTNSNNTNYDISIDSLILSPSTLLSGAYIEGSSLPSTLYNSTSFSPSYIDLTLKTSAITVLSNGTIYNGIPADTIVTINISSINGIGAWCGFPDSYFLYQANSIAQYTMQRYPFQLTVLNAPVANFTTTSQLLQGYPGIGSGCGQWKYCNNNGICDYCLQQCLCDVGYGAPSDVVTAGRDIKLDCSERKLPL